MYRMTSECMVASSVYFRHFVCILISYCTLFSISTEYLQSGSKFCALCASECNGCTGPTVDNCIQCADGFFKSIDDDQLG